MTAKEIQLHTKGLTLLYAEDEFDIREQTTQFLQNFFRQVDVAPDGASALKCFSQTKHDIIITDLKMPRMDGETFLKAAKELAPQTITVAMSGISGEDENKPTACDYYLKKPATTTMLLDLLETIITEHISNR